MTSVVAVDVEGALLPGGWSAGLVAAVRERSVDEEGRDALSVEAPPEHAAEPTSDATTRQPMINVAGRDLPPMLLRDRLTTTCPSPVDVSRGCDNHPTRHDLPLT